MLLWFTDLRQGHCFLEINLNWSTHIRGVYGSFFANGICEFYGLRFFIQALRVPVHILLPVVFVFTTVGAFALSNNAFNVVAILVFGFIGYLFVKFGIPQAPLSSALFCGMAETNFRRALMFSRNNSLISLQNRLPLYLYTNCRCFSLFSNKGYKR